MSSIYKYIYIKLQYIKVQPFKVTVCVTIYYITQTATLIFFLAKQNSNYNLHKNTKRGNTRDVVCV
uniref:Uncharacterized protein n=1 Tax=Anguilla anguilla TaxID=7936 RepID=A0A0E9XVV9_ANGAN